MSKAAGTVKLAGNDGDIQEPIVNHDEAYELACLKRTDSNLARCYLALAAERDACSTLVGQRDKEIEALAEDVRATAREKAALAAEQANAIESAHDATLRAQRLHDELTAAQAAAAAATSSEERLREALTDYGMHGYSCLIGNYNPTTGGPHGCTCGLDAALSTHPSAREQGEAHE